MSMIPLSKSSPESKKTTTAQPGSFFKGRNQASFFSPSVQAKLTVNAPNDVYEQEADAVADQVVQAKAAGVQLYAKPAIQTKCAHCEEEDKIQKQEDNNTLSQEPVHETGGSTDEADGQPLCGTGGSTPPPPPGDEPLPTPVQLKALSGTVQTRSNDNGSSAGGSIEASLSSSKGGGQSLSPGVQQQMESSIGADFSAVKIHTGSNAVQMSKELNAQAFTHGSDIYFNEGKYNPATNDGQHLLAHELTHVVQQGAAAQSSLIQRAPECKTGNKDGLGVNIKPDLMGNIYFFWTTWLEGDTMDSNIRRTMPLWLNMRYGKRMSEEHKKWAVEYYLKQSRQYIETSKLVAGCQYQVLLDLNTYALFNVMAGENTVAGSSGKSGPSGKQVSKTYNAFSKLRADEKEKIKKLLKDWLGEPAKDEKKDEKAADNLIKVSDAEAQALLSLADNPNRDAILAKLKALKQGGDGNETLEELLARAGLGEAMERMGLSASDEKKDPVENRPVRGYIKNADPDIVPAKEIAFQFVVEDDRDAWRVPWITISWNAVSDPQEKNTDAFKKFMFKEKANSHYSPIKEQGFLNDKYFKVKFPQPGTYVIEAVVNHNFFRPNIFYTRVVVISEKELLKAKEGEAMKGFAEGGKTEEGYKFKDASITYDTGSKTTGDIDASFKGMTADQELAAMKAEKERINNIVKVYKDKGGQDAQAIAEWAEKYLKKIDEHITRYENESKAPGTTVIPCRGAYVSRTGGVNSGPLKLSCLIRKVRRYDSRVDREGFPVDEIGTPMYQVVLFDYTQLYENDNYTVTEEASTSEAAMEKAFVTHSTHYPFGTLSLAFQRYDDSAEKLGGQFVKFGKVTDTLGKDIKSVLFSAPVSVAVNIVSTLLTLFPPTSAAGIAIGVAYNSASTLSDLEESASKGTLTAGKVMRGVGSMALDIIPIAGKASRVISVGSKAYLAFEAAQYAGQAYLMYEGGMEEVEKVRNGILHELADLEDEIQQVKARNPSDPKIKELEKRQSQLVTKGRNAVGDTFATLIGEFGFMMVSTKILHDALNRKFGTSKAELQEKGLFEHEPGKDLHYDYNTGKIKGDGNKASPQQFSHAERKAYYDHMIAESQKTGQADMAKNAEGRKAVVEKLAQHGDVEIKPGGKETKLVQEGDKRVLYVAEGAGLDNIHAAIDGSGLKIPDPAPVKPVAAPHEDKPPKGAADPNAKLKKEQQTPVTPTKEIHEHKMYEDGTIARCSDECQTLLMNINDRSGRVGKTYPKDHPTRKELDQLKADAAAIEKESKKNARQNPSDDAGKKAKSDKEDELLQRAKDLELKIAALERKVIPDIEARNKGLITELETTVKTYSEYAERMNNKLAELKNKMAELTALQTSPDPAVREKAANELLEMEKQLAATKKDLAKRIENTKKPNISETFDYDEDVGKNGNTYKTAQGKLGIPGEVKEVRSGNEQSKVSSGTGDDAGHLIANLFGGSGDARNLSKQNFTSNQTGSWKQLENTWAQKLKDGVEIRAKVTDITKKGEDRPFMRRAEWTEKTPDGKVTSHVAEFMNPHTSKSRDKQNVKPTVPPGNVGSITDLNAYRTMQGLPVVTADDFPSANDNSLLLPANDNKE